MPTIYAATIPSSVSAIPGPASKVGQSSPPLTPRILGQELAPVALLTDALRFYRANPDALLGIFKKGQEIFYHPADSAGLSASAKEALVNIQKLMETLLVSPASLKDPLFLRNYITNLGLSLESQWQALAKQEKPLSQPPADNLKGSLLKLSAALQAQLKENSSLRAAELPELQLLAKFTEGAAKAIETQQLLNVFSQENGDKYLLPIPLFFPTGVRNGEIIIDTGQGEGKRKGGMEDKFHVVMFLNMDNLGDMMVDATLAGKKLSGVFKFADQEAREYFSSFMDALRAALRQAGYECDYLTCTTTPNIRMERQDYHREIFREQDAVNLYA